MSAAPVVSISYLTGTIRLEPTLYHINDVKIARWWWGHRIDYQIVTQFTTLGGFSNREEAHSAARACGFEWRGGL